jgi:Methyltransferase domain
MPPDMRALKAAVRNLGSLARFTLAMRRFQLRLSSDRRVSLSAVLDAWGNAGFVADPSYLGAVVQHAQAAPGAILECGSGLTTLLLASIAPERTSSLEHLEIWRRHVRTRLWWAGGGASILRAPLRSYGSFEWYGIPSDLPRQFSLVVCDGPPAGTLGGRYGLLPVMGDRLCEGAIILLHDAERDGERAVLDRWAKEAGWRYSIHGDAKRAYAVVTV